MRHQVFFETLSTYTDEEPGWQPIMLGLLVMRLFDDWQRLGPVRIGMEQAVQEIAKELNVVSGSTDGEVINVLRQIVDTLTKASDTRVRYVEAPFHAYAMLLEEKGQWALAADVYHSIADVFESEYTSEQSDFASAAHARRKQGFCLRNAKQYAQAKVAYKKAIWLARKGEDDSIWLWARLGLATIARVRGNLPVAERKLDRLLADCETCDPKARERMRPEILHTRAAVRYDQNRDAEALLDYYEAYKTSSNAHSQEFILTDLGICAGDVGFRDLAKDALGIVLLTAEHTLPRQAAIVNLIRIAVLDESQTNFERMRRAWAPDHCDPLLNAYARLFIARGLEKFGSCAEALHAYSEAASFAESAQIHKPMFEALGDLERLKQNAVRNVPRSEHRPLPDSLVHVSHMLSQMHLLALAGQRSEG